MRTTDYSQAARERLGQAVATARAVAGYPTRPAFAKVVGISLRHLFDLETGKPGISITKLRQVARHLANWTEDTPRLILEGASAPSPETPAPPQPKPNANAEPMAMMSFLAIADRLPPEKLAEFIRVGKKRLPDVRKWYGDEAHDEVALKLTQLAERAGQSFEELLDDSA